MNKVLNILAIIAGIAMVLFGANKFGNFIPMPPPTPEQQAMFGAFMSLKWILPLAGVGEILGGAALAWPKTRALGAVMLFPITLGIIINAIVLDNSALPMSAVFFIINLWVIYDNRSRYMHMINE